MLVLCCCTQAFFHFGEWRLRSRSGAVPALVAEHRLKSPLLQQLQYMDLVALRHVESPQIRDRTYAPALAGGFLTIGPPGK